MSGDDDVVDVAIAEMRGGRDEDADDDELDEVDIAAELDVIFGCSRPTTKSLPGSKTGDP